MKFSPSVQLDEPFEGLLRWWWKAHRRRALDKAMKLSVLIAESNSRQRQQGLPTGLRDPTRRVIYHGDPRKVVENHEVMNIILGKPPWS